MLGGEEASRNTLSLFMQQKLGVRNKLGTQMRMGKIDELKQETNMSYYYDMLLTCISVVTVKKLKCQELKRPIMWLATGLKS